MTIILFLIIWGSGSIVHLLGCWYYLIVKEAKREYVDTNDFTGYTLLVTIFWPAILPAIIAILPFIGIVAIIRKLVLHFHDNIVKKVRNRIDKKLKKQLEKQLEKENTPSYGEAKNYRSLPEKI